MQDMSTLEQINSIHNIRDYGGYRLPSGGSLVTGKVFRSGDFSKASDRDLAYLAQLDVVALVDLRGNSERESDPTRLGDNFAPKIYHSNGETALKAPTVAPHLEGLNQKQNASDIRKEMLRRYSDMPFRPYLIESYQKYLQVLAEIEGSSVVFCTAGKDRTGLLVALVQSLLGVHRDDVMEEFLLTNTAPGQEARIEAIRGHLHERFGDGLTEDAIEVIVSVEAAFLESAFNAIIEKHGSIEVYAHEVLRLDPANHSAIVDNLTG